MKNKKIRIFSTVALLSLFAIPFTSCENGNKQSEQQATTLKDFAVPGGLYTGEATDGKATGNGSIVYDNGNRYEGAVVDGVPSGAGVMIDAINEGTYTGLFVNGLYEDAAGVFEYDNGGSYTGHFEAGTLKGQGKFTWPAGHTLEGNFLGNGLDIDCDGTLLYSTGLWFEGRVERGATTTGTMFWPGGLPKYTGTFTDFLTGYGNLDMGNGILYYGPMGGGLLVPVAAWDALDTPVTISYPTDGTYNGEQFSGAYVYNDVENKDELVGVMTYTDGTTKNVKISTDFVFSYTEISTEVTNVVDEPIEGGTYTGTMIGGELTGHGTITYDNGDVYVGDIVNGKLHGTGTYSWANGMAYEGEYVSGGYGNGTFKWPGGSPSIAGTFTDFITGYGELDMGNGIIYNGPMNGGVLGITLDWPSLDRNVEIQYPEQGDTGTYHGEHFVGNYSNGKLVGTVTYVDSSTKDVEVNLDFSFSYSQLADVITQVENYAITDGTYTGSMTNGQVTGSGTITYTNGDVYVGEVKDGLPDGMGTYTEASGCIFVGTMSAGGYANGTFTWPAGDKLTGEFTGIDRSLNCQGKLEYTNGMSAEGTFVNAAITIGTIFWPNGSPKIEGQFTAWLNGYGELDMGNGILYYGPMSNGALGDTAEWVALNQDVTVQYPDQGDGGLYHGERFVGRYSEGVLRGTVTYSDGTTKEVIVDLNFAFSYHE